MKVSKVVLFVVALHVLVIGGIFVFEGCSRAKTPGPQLADNETQPGVTPLAPAPSTLPAPVAENNLAPAAPVTAPPPVPAPAAPAPLPTKTYVVKKGDSLYKIAKAEKVTIEQLAKANNLSNTSRLQIGQTLVIPTPVAKTETPAAPASTATASASAPSASTASDGRYEVKAGDSLWKIAKNNGITVAALKKANNLSTDKLKVGQKLIIPSKAATTTTVTTSSAPSDPNQAVCIVTASDTLASIAQRYGVRVEDLMRLNKLNGTTRLTEGQKLLIPQAAPTPANAGPAVIAPNLIGN